MTCSCASFYYVLDITNPDIQDFKFDNFEKIDTIAFIEFYKCPQCSQIWGIPVIDILQTRTAIKVSSVEEYNNLDFEKVKTDLLISIWGTANMKCIWKDCNNSRLNDGSVYCAWHSSI